MRRGQHLSIPVHIFVNLSNAVHAKIIHTGTWGREASKLLCREACSESMMRGLAAGIRDSPSPPRFL